MVYSCVSIRFNGSTRKGPRLWHDPLVPSNARIAFDVALADVDAQIAHAASFAGGTRGAPAAVGGVARPGRPFTRAATVMLAAGFEGFVEALVTEMGSHLSLTPEQSRDLRDQVARSHGSNVGHVHSLLATVGLPFVLDTIGWRGLPRGEVRAFVKELSAARNKIAHGAAPRSAQLVDVQRWRRLIARLADELDKKASAHVLSVTSANPW